MIFEMCGIRSGAFGNYWGMRASAGLMRMYELQKLVVAAADDLGDASALHVHTPGSHAQILELFSLSLPV